MNTNAAKIFLAKIRKIELLLDPVCLIGFITDKLLWSRNRYFQKSAKAKYNIHRSVRWGLGTTVYGEGEIKIGKNSYLGYDCMIQSDPPGVYVEIGEHCALAHNIQIRTSSYDIQGERGFYRAQEISNISKSIKIGDYVWIGCNVYINQGVTIGSNVVIGANSVITKDVASNCVVAGIPAKLIRSFKDE